MPTLGNLTQKCRRCLETIAQSGPSTAEDLNARFPTLPDHKQTLKAAQQAGYVTNQRKGKHGEPALYALTAKAIAVLADPAEVAALASNPAIAALASSRKKPNFLNGSDKLSQKTRLAMRMPPCAPRVRQPGEAMPTVVCNASNREPYRPGQGDYFRQPVRAGAAQAMAIKSYGVRT